MMSSPVRITKAFSVPIESERGSIYCFDAFSSREPVSIPDRVRNGLSLENALLRRHSGAREA
jgi:hypothetical protein